MTQKPSPRTNQPSEDWLSNLFSERPSFVSEKHPALQELKSYLDGRLLNEDRQHVYDSSRTDWTMTKVSFHLLDCPSCSAQIAQLRQLEVVCHRAMKPTWWELLRDRLLQPRAVRAHFKTFATVAVVLLTINLGIWFWVSNAPQTIKYTEADLMKADVTSPEIGLNSEPVSGSTTLDFGENGNSSVSLTENKSQAPTQPATKPEPMAPAPPSGFMWWSLSLVLLWASLWFAHLLTQSQQRWRQALQRVFSPRWYAEPRFDSYHVAASAQLSSWASLARC